LKEKAAHKIGKKAGWSYYYLPELEERGITHGFFTALSPSHRLEGREKREFLETFSLKDLVVMTQEHGDTIHVVRDGYRPSSGDGIIVLEKGIAAIIKTADCLPVILAEPDCPVAAIVHAGWRGTVKKITGKAVRKLVDLGADRKKITAVLGPSIGPCCYEVQKDVQDIFAEEGFSSRVIRRAEGSLMLDIREANREILTNEGIEQIYDMALCTFCSGNIFHSYRRGEKDRRQINFVSLRG
jgi:polyphenol oxidase